MKNMLLGVLIGAVLSALVLNGRQNVQMIGRTLIADARAAPAMAPPPGAQVVDGAWCHLMSQGNPAQFEREIAQYYAGGAQVVSYVYNNMNTALVCYRPQ